MFIAMSNFPKNILQIGYVLNNKWVIIEFIGKGAVLSNPDTPFLKKIGPNHSRRYGRKEKRTINIGGWSGNSCFGSVKYPGQQFNNFQYPWEAFANVGFRCAIRLGNKPWSTFVFVSRPVANDVKRKNTPSEQVLI
jgi:hypothetical protein